MGMEMEWMVKLRRGHAQVCSEAETSEMRSLQGQAARSALLNHLRHMPALSGMLVFARTGTHMMAVTRSVQFQLAMMSRVIN